jgi:outer membrane protein assembly complex protein YaeT
MAGLSRWRPVLVATSRARTHGLLGLALLVLALGCHEGRDVKVASLQISGNDAIPSKQLTRVLATRKSGWLPWATKHYFDRAEFDADLRRIENFYADRGYPHAKVTGVDVQFNDARDAVRLTIRIVEGAPLIVDFIRLEGFDALPERVRTGIAAAPIATGVPRDRTTVQATRDLGGRLLRNDGYPLGEVDVVEEPLPIADRVGLVVRAKPGAPMVFGEVGIVGLESVQENIVRRELAFVPGQVYREAQVIRTQRRLSRLELFDFTTVAPRPEDAASGQMPIRVTVAEGPPRRLKLGAGYGAEDRVRGLVQWTHVNFTGGARQAGVEAKWSYIDRGARLTFAEPHLFRPDLSLRVTGQAWRTNQVTYDSQTYGGVATVTYRRERGALQTNNMARYEVRGGYAYEYLRYGVVQTALDDLSTREDRIALGLDPETGRAVGTLASLFAGITRNAVDRPAEPTRGTTVSMQVEQAASWLAGTYQFTEVLAEARVYRPLGPAHFSARARFGTLGATDPLTVPFSRRYFLGGSSSLRGWGRFQVSPLSQTGLPVGGRSMMEFSGEMRFPIRGRLSGAAFVDAGNVWAGDWEAHPGDLRWSVGPGLRFETPIGPVRADFGFQLTPIAGLVINGTPEARRWRLHFSIGPPF